MDSSNSGCLWSYKRFVLCQQIEGSVLSTWSRSCRMMVVKSKQETEVSSWAKTMSYRNKAPWNFKWISIWTPNSRLWRNVESLYEMNVWHILYVSCGSWSENQKHNEHNVSSIWTLRILCKVKKQLSLVIWNLEESIQHFHGNKQILPHSPETIDGSLDPARLTADDKAQKRRGCSPSRSLGMRFSWVKTRKWKPYWCVWTERDGCKR